MMREFKITRSFIYTHETEGSLEITCFVKGGSIFLNDSTPNLEHYFVVHFDRYRPKQIESNKNCLEEVPYVSEGRDAFIKRASAIERDFVVHKRLMLR